jgi:hypothetical protein
MNATGDGRFVCMKCGHLSIPGQHPPVSLYSLRSHEGIQTWNVAMVVGAEGLVSVVTSPDFLV